MTGLPASPPRTGLRLRPEGKTGCVLHVTPPLAHWDHVGFDLWKTPAGQVAGGFSPNRESCLVLVTGMGTVTIDGVAFGDIGGRTSPFEGKPSSVYVPPGARWSVTALTDVEMAVCTAPARGGLAPRLILPDALSVMTRGKGSNTRYVTNILAETDVAESLLVVEVITPGGNTSSYPPHKHDTDNLPHESILEETYYHRLNPPQGFAFQRVYTDDRSLDEALVVEDGDVVLVPRGYHPCATVHGYDLYYLNVMAGPKRTWKFHNDPAHEWLLA